MSDAASVSSADETSGYESEGCRSVSPVYPLSPPRQDRPGVDPHSEPPGRRPRTAFTAEQINRLERTFKKQSYVGTREKEELCKKLNLSEKQVRERRRADHNTAMYFISRNCSLSRYTAAIKRMGLK